MYIIIYIYIFKYITYIHINIHIYIYTYIIYIHTTTPVFSRVFTTASPPKKIDALRCLNRLVLLPRRSISKNWWLENSWFDDRMLHRFLEWLIHPWRLMAGTWEYGPPGKGKSSSQPSFSGSMLIFGGVPVSIFVFLRCCQDAVVVKKIFIDVISLCVSFCVLILIQLCTKFVERGRGFYVRWWIRWDSILCAWYGLLCEEGGRARKTVDDCDDW